jgi:hypothetical protein
LIVLDREAAPWALPSEDHLAHGSAASSQRAESDRSTRLASVMSGSNLSPLSGFTELPWQPDKGAGKIKNRTLA